MSRDEPRIMVVGAGIGGLSAVLSLHEIGANVDVFESVREVRPLGVGINLLPHAVRELDALGLLEPLRSRSVEPTSLAYCSRHGQEIWREPRGTAAGYSWPQLSLNRGALQEVLLDAFVDRVGPDHLHLGHRLERIDADDTGASVVFATEHDGTRVAVGAGVVAADGIHSTARSQHYPSEGRPQWNGSLLGAVWPRSNHYWMGARWSGPVIAIRSSLPIRSLISRTVIKRSTSSPSFAALGPGSERPRIGTEPAS